MNNQIALVFWCIVLSSSAFSQSSTLYSREFIVDSLEYKVYWSDSEKQVIEEVYYKDEGKRESEIFEIDGKLNGTIRKWYPNGQIRSLENYVYDIPAGIWFYFYSDGKIKELRKFSFTKEDIFLGICAETSLVDIAVTHDSSKMTTDTLVTAYSCKKPDCILTYYRNGNKKSEEYYSRNKKNGHWKYYSELGKLLREKEFLNDKLIRETNY